MKALNKKDVKKVSGGAEHPAKLINYCKNNPSAHICRP